MFVCSFSIPPPVIANGLKIYKDTKGAPAKAFFPFTISVKAEVFAIQWVHGISESKRKVFLD